MDRLTALRDEMKTQGVDGVLIPRGDAFSGEEVPPSDDRLKYISGFTGSAGTALVTATQAALFSDGRYTLQMAAETNDDWSCHVQPEADMMQWMLANLEAGALGFDPWLLTASGHENLSSKLADTAISLMPLDRNLIDQIWPDQPQPPTSKAWDFDPAIAGMSRQDKINTVLSAINNKHSQARHMVITAPDQLAWLANIRGYDLDHTPVILAFALLNYDGSITVFADEDQFADCDQAGLVFIPKDHCLTHLAGLKAKEVMIDPATCPYAIARLLGDDAIKGESPITMMKARKNKAEQQAIRAVHRRDGAAMAEFLSWFDAASMAGQGLRETDIDAKLIAIRSQDDLFISPSFSTICGSGGNGAIVHYRAQHGQDSEILMDTLCLIDSGGQYQDGTTDITRTVAVGTPSQQMRHDFTVVLKGHIALDQAIFPPDTTGVQLDAITRDPIWQAGLDYAHGTGHGVGCCLNVHEGPVSISKRSMRAVEEGLLLSNEPGYYIENEYGIRIENLILAQNAPSKDGYLCFEAVTLAPMDRCLIDVTILDDQELDWINAYHQRVWDEVSPLLADKDDVLTWLKSATTPLQR